jgi:hypothetical protein
MKLIGTDGPQTEPRCLCLLGLCTPRFQACAAQAFFKLPLRCSLRHIQRCNVTSLWLSLAGYLCLQNKMVTFVLILLACVTYVLGKKKR